MQCDRFVMPRMFAQGHGEREQSQSHRHGHLSRLHIFRQWHALERHQLTNVGCVQQPLHKLCFAATRVNSAPLELLPQLHNLKCLHVWRHCALLLFVAHIPAELYIPAYGPVAHRCLKSAVVDLLVCQRTCLECAEGHLIHDGLCAGGFSRLTWLSGPTTDWVLAARYKRSEARKFEDHLSFATARADPLRPRQACEKSILSELGGARRCVAADWLRGLGMRSGGRS
mmetsp:Transcript_64518/g.107207  ORF Transcript_64518/g.107207 Transcript_64518/m.107207 type:complete len:227 (-) Transcript_64518:579-1259(-)